MKRCVVIVVVMMLVLSGCTATHQAKSKSDITVLFVPKVTGNAFFESANDGAQAYAAKQGFSVRYEGSPMATVDKQIAIIEGAVADQVDAICISSLDATALDDALKQVQKAGVKVVTWDSDVSGDARTLMVSQGTPVQLGTMLVEMGAKSLTSRGKNPATDAIQYAWHYSQATVTDQNSWQVAGEKYIQATYPNWVNVAPENYYSGQDAERAVEVGQTILADHPDIDLIICNDSTALPGQAQAAQNLGLDQTRVTITGFASPNPMREYCKAGIVERWGLWDCKVQGALGCYLACYLAMGNQPKVGDTIDVPDVGLLEIMPNSVLDPNAYTSSASGVVLLPKRTEFTISNVDDYDF